MTRSRGGGSPVRNRLLTNHELLGLTGDELPLTDADVRAAVAGAYSAAAAAAVLQGRTDEQARRSTGGSVNDIRSGQRAEWLYDAGGMWVVLCDVTPTRAGHITWPTAERILRNAVTADTAGTLIRAVQAHQTHVVAHLTTWRPDSRSPVERSADREEGLRLFAAERAAWARIEDLICAPAPEQLALFGEDGAAS